MREKLKQNRDQINRMQLLIFEFDFSNEIINFKCKINAEKMRITFSVIISRKYIYIDTNIYCVYIVYKYPCACLIRCISGDKKIRQRNSNGKYPAKMFMN